jgi:hypothetical protein
MNLSSELQALKENEAMLKEVVRQRSDSLEKKDKTPSPDSGVQSEFEAHNKSLAFERARLEEVQARIAVLEKI